MKLKYDITRDDKVYKAGTEVNYVHDLPFGMIEVLIDGDNHCIHTSLLSNSDNEIVRQLQRPRFVCTLR